MRVLGRKPAFWPTVISLPCFVVALALGTWQVQRLAWKEGLIAERGAQLGAAPVPLPTRIAPGDLALDFRRVRVIGTFLHDREIHLAARSLRGNPGYDVITPLRRRDGTMVFVDRGWVPPERKAADKRKDGQITGEVTVDGIARTRFARGYFQPDNDVAKNVWFWIDFAAMARVASVAVEPVIIEAGESDIPGGLPKGGQTRIDLRNQHLSYVITWYSVALTIAVIYVLWHRRQAKDPPEKAEVAR
jgi:surfeit locus 1 family protein